MRLPSPILLGVLAALAPIASAQLQLVDEAAAAGVDDLTFGRGAAMADLDGDGLPDLIATNASFDHRFYRQRPDHTFEDANHAWAIPPNALHPWGVLAADFDNDGDLDVYFVNGGFAGPEPNQLLRNDVGATGVFVDVSASSGDGDLVSQTFGATALDYDADGLLDVFMSNHLEPPDLIRNLGGLVFVDDSPTGIPAEQYKHCGSGDYDNDGWIDVGVGNMSGPNLLFRNGGDGTFAEVAAQAGVDAPTFNFGFVFQDYDGDGWLDAYVPKYQLNPSGPSLLFMNQEDGTFLDVSASSGMTGQTDMGHDSGDLDADGYADVYVGTGSPGTAYEDVLFRVEPDGAGGLTATDVTDSSGVALAGKTRSHGTAFGDVDLDGDVDVFVNTGGPSWLFETVETNILWRNQGNANAWISVELEGVLSNRGGVGARGMAVTASGREVHLQHSVGRGFANTPLAALHFGLGAETTVDRIEVDWPSGIGQTLLSPPAFARLTVLETGIRLLGTPALGASITLESCGPAGDAVFLGVSPNLVHQPLPAFGGIKELGDPLIEVANTALGADGKTSIPLTIPSVPVLAGTTWYMQAWIHPPGTTSGGTITNTIVMSL